jgi:hypothetical protein
MINDFSNQADKNTINIKFQSDDGKEIDMNILLINNKVQSYLYVQIKIELFKCYQISYQLHKVY